MLTIERILWTSAGSATPPPVTMRRRMAETSSHSWRKYLRRTTSLESCSSSPTAVGSMEASPSAATPAGSDRAIVAALGSGAAEEEAAAAASSITGAQGGCPTGVAAVRALLRWCVFCWCFSVSVFAVRRRIFILSADAKTSGGHRAPSANSPLSPRRSDLVTVSADDAAARRLRPAVGHGWLRLLLPHGCRLP